jgi:hypothetical protein
VNIKAEEVSDTEEEEEDPMPITFLELKAEPEVSCMSLYAHCQSDITNMQKALLWYHIIGFPRYVFKAVICFLTSLLSVSV